LSQRLLVTAALVVALVSTTGTTLAIGPSEESVRSRAPVVSQSVSYGLWDTALLGRWVAIDAMLRKYTHRYRIPTLWTTMAFASESVLDPIAKGPLPGDRGIGQVGFAAEFRGFKRGTDPNNPDYNSDLDPHGSIWDPRVNIILASILFGWVYTQPYVTSPAEAYAVYTYGPSAILPNGHLTPAAQARVTRAESFQALLSGFGDLKRRVRGLSPVQLKRLIPDPLTRAVIQIDGRNADGEKTYHRLTAMYLKEITTTSSAWDLVIFGHEALNFADVGRRVYHKDESVYYKRLLAVLLRQEKIVPSNDPALGAAFITLVATARLRTRGR
jgi:hypothetical protein